MWGGGDQAECQGGGSAADCHAVWMLGRRWFQAGRAGTTEAMTQAGSCCIEGMTKRLGWLHGSRRSSREREVWEDFSF